MPAYVFSVLEVLLAEGESVVLGLEFPEDEQPALDAYLRSQGAPADREELLRGHFWRLLAVDGRGSQAMLELIDTLRQQIARGDPVEVYDLEDGAVVATGICQYSSEQLGQIKGSRSEQISQILGFAYKDVVIHRGDMVLTQNPPAVD